MNEGSYKNGKEEGVWKNWWWNSNKSYEGIYENGSFVKLVGSGREILMNSHC